MDKIQDQNVKSKYEIEYELAVSGIPMISDIRSDSETQKNINTKDASMDINNTIYKTESVNKFIQTNNYLTSLIFKY